MKPHSNYLAISDGPPLQFSFASACQHHYWSKAIDREYNALVHRNTWKHIARNYNITPVPFKWIFRKIKIDHEGKEFLYKSRCVLRGDKQSEYIKFDSDQLYAPVAAHESLRMLLALGCDEEVILEGVDVDNAYLYCKLDIPITMEQPTDSSQILARPGMVSVIFMSLYGTRKAGLI